MIVFRPRRSTCFRGTLVSAILLGGSVYVPGAATADAPPRSSAAPEDSTAAEIRRLVQQLGSEDYHTREAASATLVELGPDVVPHLEEAVQSPVLEIHTRAERLLAIVSRESFEQAIQAFVADVDGRRGTTLPGWERARRRLGETESARRLFVEMYRAEPVVLAAYGDDNLKAQSAVAVRVEELRGQQSQQSHVNFRARNQIQQATTANVMALLFVGADSELELSQQVAGTFRKLLEDTWPPSRVNSAAERDYLREWLAEWITHHFAQPHQEYEGILLGMQYDIPEVLDMAVEVLRRGGGHAYSRMRAALCIGKYGKDWQLPLVESLLDDEASVGRPQQNINNRIIRFETQLRDVALVVLLNRTGQDPKDYGVAELDAGVEYENLFRSIAFEDDEARARASAKWYAWRKGHALFDGEPPQPFTTTEPPDESGAAPAPE